MYTRVFIGWGGDVDLGHEEEAGWKGVNWIL
jgi:hypothetical protein